MLVTELRNPVQTDVELQPLTERPPINRNEVNWGGFVISWACDVESHKLVAIPNGPKPTEPPRNFEEECALVLLYPQPLQDTPELTAASNKYASFRAPEIAIQDIR